MFTNLSGKIIPVAFVILVVSGAGYWYSVNFSPPVNAIVTDVTDTAAAIVWETKASTNATVYYAKNPLLIRFLPLTLPWVRIKHNTTISVNHRIKLAGLSPGTAYTFAIGSGVYFYQVGRYTTIQTIGTTKSAPVTSSLPVISTLSGPQAVTSQGLIYGVIRDYQFHPILGAIVVAVIPGDNPRIYSDTTEKEGFFGFYVPEATGSMMLQVFNGTKSQTMVPILWDKKIKSITVALR